MAPRTSLKIQIVSPCGRSNESKIRVGVSLLKAHDFHTIKRSDEHRTQTPSIENFEYLAGSDHWRLQTLVQALEESNLVWCARGGYGATRVLNLAKPFEFNALQHGQAALVGFSDITALHAHRFNAGQIGIHGPLITTLATSSHEARTALFKLLGPCHNVISQFGHALTRSPMTLKKKRIFVGNLCVVCHLLGTPVMPDFDDVIIAVEEINEPLYKVDRMFTQLAHAEVFRNSSALLLGAFTQPLSGKNQPGKAQHKQAKYYESVVALAHNAFPHLPIAFGFPFGHIADNHALPVGAYVDLELANSKATLKTHGLNLIDEEGALS